MKYSLILIIICMCACSQPHTIAFQRGAAEELEVDKQVRKGKVWLNAERISTHQIELTALQCSDIKLTRQVKFTTIEWLWVDAHPVWELFEIPYGIVSIPLLPFFYIGGLMEPPPDRENFRYDRRRFLLGKLFGAINPFERLIPSEIMISHDSQRDLFRGKPVQIQYEMCQPIRHVQVNYQLSNVHGEHLRGGEVKTDWFGSAIFNDLPNEWMSVTLVHGETQYRGVILAHPKAKRLAK